MPTTSANIVPKRSIMRMTPSNWFAKAKPSSAYAELHSSEPVASYATNPFTDEPSVPANGGETPSNPGTNFAISNRRNPQRAKMRCERSRLRWGSQVRLQTARMTLDPQRRPNQNQKPSAARHPTMAESSTRDRCNCPCLASVPAAMSSSIAGTGRPNC